MSLAVMDCTFLPQACQAQWCEHVADCIVCPAFEGVNGHNECYGRAQLFRTDDRLARRQQASAELGVGVEALRALPRAVRQAAASGTLRCNGTPTKSTGRPTHSSCWVDHSITCKGNKPM